MNILWILDKEFDIALNVSARLATIEYLENRHNLTVVTSFRRERKKFENIKSEIIYLKTVKVPILKIGSLYYRQLKFIDRGLNLRKYDLVYINSNNIFMLKKLIRIRKRNEFKLVLDVRTLPAESNSLKRYMSYFLLKRCLVLAARHFNGVSYITESLRKYCERRFRLCRHCYVVWSTGVDLDKFRPLVSSSANPKKLRIMYHGNVAKNRGISSVVLAISRLREIDVEFLILGCGSELNKLRRLVRDSNLENRVVFLGDVPHDRVPDFIALADAGILPFPNFEQWNTSSAIKLFEYMACGRPVIVTKIPAHLDVLDGKEFAFWADTSSPNDLAKAIRAAFCQKPNFSRIGVKARDFTEGHFGWNNQLSILDEFIKNL
jgi:glycosyltransferase involved in cell wall biosynthesis